MTTEALGQDSLLGRTLGHYRIVEEIGAGGMGVVYRARDEHLDRDVAIKILPPGLPAEGTAHQRFHKEALSLSRLNHPNIATVHDFDSCDGIEFLAEELVPGVSLDEMLSSGPLSEKQIVSLGAQLCEGLAAAHARGILHRDIKPANLRVVEEECPDRRLVKCG
jgi:serine/threonine protein kinase